MLDFYKKKYAERALLIVKNLELIKLKNHTLPSLVKGGHFEKGIASKSITSK